MLRATSPTLTDNTLPQLGNPSSTRRTFGVLLDRMALFPGGYEEELRRQFHAAAVQLDVNLRIAYGDAVARAGAKATGSNALYDLVTPRSVDGLVAVSSSLEAGCGALRLSEFLSRYQPLPLCSVGIELPGVPSIVVSGAAAVQDLVTHLVEQHGARSLLFIEGRVTHPESLERRAACESVAARMLGRMPSVKTGNFSRQGGYQATLEAIDQGIEFDAVIAANDHMALGALKALRERGIARELPVTGFDDLNLARVCHPPLTTVAQPFKGVAFTALSHLLSELSGTPAPLRTELSATLSLRESCGCTRLLHPNSALVAERATNAERLEHSRAILQAAIEASGAPEEPYLSLLLRGLSDEIERNEGAFASALEQLLGNALRDETLHIHLGRALHELEVVWRAAGTLPERLWQRTNRAVIRASTSAQVQLRQELHAEHARFLASGDLLSAARDRAGVAQALSETLSAVGLEDACISTFADADKRELCLLAVGPRREGAAAPSERFPAVDLVPDWWRRTSARHTLVLLPLAVEDTCFGIAAFGYPCAGFGPQIIANQVALAMRNAALHATVIEQTVRSERNLQERRAASQRLEAIGVLAGSVAHDLNNALGPLVALPEVMIEELSELSGDPSTLENLRQDVEAIRVAAVRATGTILDLLTLGRRGRVPNTLLDLNQSAAEAARAREYPEQEHRALEVELYTGELMVSASTSQLSRALSHLLKNAEQATSRGGAIQIRTSKVSVAEPLHGYETIPPNRYGVIEVADNGTGIQDANLERIFEPYYSSRMQGDGSPKSLGLALVHAVVKEHEGFIDVESDPARGTAFRLYFPLAGARSNSELPDLVQFRHSENGRLEGLRILVVDDELAQLKTAERLLTREGCHVETVDNGGDAYRRFRDSKTPLGYDLILLDVTLNETSDGIDWLERIQAVAPDQQCILMSGHATPGRAERALGKGVPWLVKPYTPEALVAMVGSVLTKGPSAPGVAGD